MPPKKKVERAATENISLGPQVREGQRAPLQPFSRELLKIFLTGELVFGVARIFASFNDTFVHVTDLRFVPTTYLKQSGVWFRGLHSG